MGRSVVDGKVYLIWSERRVLMCNDFETLSRVIRHHAVQARQADSISGGQVIVIPVAGYRAFINAYVHLGVLRSTRCKLPVEIWHSTEGLDERMRRFLQEHCVQFVEVEGLALRSVRTRVELLLASAAAFSRHEEVLVMHADSCAISDPSELFQHPNYRNTGAVFWGGIRPHTASGATNEALSVPAWDTGQFIVNRKINGPALQAMAGLLGDQHILRGQIESGDLISLVWHVLGAPYASPPPPQVLERPGLRPSWCQEPAVLCQQDFHGNRVFQHRLWNKWDVAVEPSFVPGTFMDGRCREWLSRLRDRWKGASRLALTGFCAKSRPAPHVYGKLCRSLRKNAWLLTTAQTPRRGNTASGTPTPANVPPPFREVTFARDGRILPADEDLKYWKLDTSNGVPSLLLGRETGRVLELNPAADGNQWKGRSKIPGRADKFVLIPFREIFPSPNRLLPRPPGRRQTPLASELRRRFRAGVAMHTSAPGMAAALAALAAAAAVARLGVKVTFHTAAAGWLQGHCERNMQILDAPPLDGSLDLASEDRAARRLSASWSHWIARSIHPDLLPVRPRFVLPPAIQPAPGCDRLVIFAPGVGAGHHAWPNGHWARLADYCVHEGYSVVALGHKAEEEMIAGIFRESGAWWVCGGTPDEVLALMAGASAIVAPDNDFLHLAAAHGKRVVPLMAQFPPGMISLYLTKHALRAGSGCAGCREEPSRGFRMVCHSGCSALAQVSPEMIFDQLAAATRISRSGPAKTKNAPAPEL